MRRLITWFLGALLLISTPLLFAQTHLELLKARYPYGLIGDDYGVLSADDLAVNTCGVDVTPFSKGKNMAYSYWQCFPVKSTKISCESLGLDSTEPETGYLEVRTHNLSGGHSYLARNAIKMRDCKKRLSIWNEIIAGESYVCLSGSFAISENADDGTPETGWVLDKFKTHKGCESFGLDCKLKKPSDDTCILPVRPK